MIRKRSSPSDKSRKPSAPVAADQPIREVNGASLAAEATDNSSALTLEEQTYSLDFFLKIMGHIRGGTARDVNRAVNLGAQMLGVKYERLHRMMKLAATKGTAAAVADAPNEIRFLRGEGYVYFALEPTGDRLKIGFSQDPTLRIACVTRATGVSLVEIARFGGYPIQEQAAHVAARPAWLGGEWYDFDLLIAVPEFAFLVNRKARAGL